MINFSSLFLLGGLLALAGTTQAQTFAAVTNYSSGGTQPYGVAVGDVNADGRPDIVAANNSTGTVGVLLASTTVPGTFRAATTYPTGVLTAGSNNVISVALGDVNGDNQPDITVTNTVANTVGVLLNLNLAANPGTFGPVTTYSAGGATSPRILALGDVNGDGLLDIATVGSAAGVVAFLLNSATTPGTFGAAISYSTGGTATNGLALGDMNKDGRLDAVALDRLTGQVAVLLNRPAAPGTFGAASTYANGASSSISFGLTLGDVNGDTRLDVVTANLGSPTVSVLLNSATTPGTLLAATVYSSGGTSPIEVSVADVNGDNRPDIAVTNFASDAVAVLLNSAAAPGTFAPAVSFSTGANSNPRGVVLADMNADGRRDIVVGGFGSGTVGVLLNTTPLAARATLPGTSATLAPNPTSTSTTLGLSGLPATVAQVQATLFDAAARPVRQQLLAAAQGTARTEVPTAGLAAGFYVLRLAAYDAQGQLAGSLPTQRLSVQ